LLAAKRVHLAEVFSGHPQVNNAGGASAEALWDDLLSAGRTRRRCDGHPA
jgi:hypothetical protein